MNGSVIRAQGSGGMRNPVLAGLIALSLGLWGHGRAAATDLDAPAVHKVTIGSEISRGSDAALQCTLNTPASRGWLPFSVCIDHVLSTEKQRNTETDAFDFGLSFAAYHSLGSIQQATQDVLKIDLRGDPGFMQSRQFHFTTANKLAKTLKLSAENVCQATGRKPGCWPLDPP
jgi:hypothetical protein